MIAAHNLRLRLVVLWSLAAIFLSRCTQANEKTGSDSALHILPPNQILSLYDSLYSLAGNVSDIQREKNLMDSAHQTLQPLIELKDEALIMMDTVLSRQVRYALFLKATDKADMELYSEAEEYLNSFLVFSDKTGVEYDQYAAFVDKTLGDIYARLGDYQKALLHKKHSLRYYQKVNDQNAIASECINTSIVYRELKKPDSALHYSLVGREQSLADERRIFSLLLETALASWMKSDHKNALATLTEAEELIPYMSADENSWAKMADFYQLKGKMAADSGDVKAHLTYTRMAKDLQWQSVGGRANRETGKLFIAIGKVFDLLGQPDSALVYYQKTLSFLTGMDADKMFDIPAIGDIYPENTIGEALDAKADWLTHHAPAGKEIQYFSCALNCYERANDIMFRLFSSFSYDSSRLLLLDDSKLRNEKAIVVCEALYKKTHDLGWLKRAFSFAETDKAYILAEAVKRNMQADAEEGDVNRMAMQRFKRQHALAESGRFDALVRKDTLRERMALQRMLALEDSIQIRQRLVHNREDFSSLKSGSFDFLSLNSKLRNTGKTLLEYYIGKENSWLFILKPDRPIRLIKIDTNTESDCLKFHDFFSNRSKITQYPADYLRQAYNLYVKSGINEANSNNLIIIPDGQLSKIPFEALITENKINASLVNAPYVLLNNNIAYDFSARTFVENNMCRNEPFSVFFAPSYSGRNLLPDLPSQKFEREAITNYLGRVKYYDGKNADLDTLRQLRKGKVLHVAAHAFATDALPPRIECADSTLYINELYHLPLQFNLTVISACESAAGGIQRTEGSISLARAFYYAGSAQIMSSLWKTDDAAAGVLLSEFYKQYQYSATMKALQRAKKNFINKASTASEASPFFWAGFIITGSPTPVQNNEQTGFILILFTMATAICAMISQRRLSAMKIK